jgi:hypothetical protein
LATARNLEPTSAAPKETVRPAGHCLIAYIKFE